MQQTGKRTGVTIELHTNESDDIAEEEQKKIESESLFNCNLSIYSWALKFPTVYHITVRASAGLSPNEVLERIKSGEIEFEAESYDSFTPSDFMKTCYSEENKELIMKMEEEEEEEEEEQ